jgi:hypothetical protein
VSLSGRLGTHSREGGIVQLLRTKRLSLVEASSSVLGGADPEWGAISASSQAGGVNDITVVSNRADVVSGGNALVSVDLSANPRAIEVELNGTDITGAFAVRPNGRYEGLVTGLVVGKNTLRVRPGMASAAGSRSTTTRSAVRVLGATASAMALSDAGPDQSCAGPSVDDKCNAPTVVELFYRTTSNQFVAYDPRTRPRRRAFQQTTTDQGKTVPFIVERVTGTANRGIYQFALLVDPTRPVHHGPEQP